MPPIRSLLLVAIPIALATSANAQAPAQGWTGEFSVGGSLATGNSARTALDADFRVSKREGRYEHRLRLLGDAAWESGAATAQRVKGNAQTNVDLRDRLYGFGFGEYTDDRFSGYRYEASVGTGLGYRLIDTQRLGFAIEAGPGYRFSERKDPRETEDTLFGRVFATLRYEISDTARLTNETLVTVDRVRTKAENTVAVTSKLVGNLSGRLSFNVRHNTNPPVGPKRTDTLTRISLVYGF